MGTTGGRLNLFWKELQLCRGQSGMTFDPEIGVFVQWPQEFTERSARSGDAVHRPLGTRQSCLQRIGGSAGSSGNPCRARDVFGSRDNSENTITGHSASASR